MGRIGVALAALAVVLGGLVPPASARPAATPADTLTGGTVTFVFGQPSPGYMASTFSGQFAAGGRVYTGTATGSDLENDPYALLVDVSGTSSTGTMSASCSGTWLPLEGGVPQPPSQAPGLLPLSCSVAIDGAPAQPVELILAMEQTDASTYTGVFAAGPDALGLPSVPLVSFGTAAAETQSSGVGDDISFGFQGQISLGTETFRGSAGGGEPWSPIFSVTPVSPFVLSGSSPTGGLNATCSGVFVAQGVALSVLLCNGSANGGPSGPAVLVSAYVPVTPGDLSGNAAYTGVFVGV